MKSPTRVKKPSAPGPVPAPPQLLRTASKPLFPTRTQEVPAFRDEALYDARTALGHNFGDMALTAPVADESSAFSRINDGTCPLSLDSPRACPFGGACHTCPLPVQAKPAVSQPGDMYEQEADQVAERVMRMSEDEVLQRQCPTCSADEDEVLQPKELPGQASPATPLSEVPPLVHEVLHSPGQPMDPASRASMEPRLGHDFSQVRVHADARAAESARALQASAYTFGRDVVFGAGRYAPGTSAGQHLLAHELAHVVQQSRGGVRPDAELRAQEAAAAVGRGDTVAAETLGGAPVGIQAAGEGEEKTSAKPPGPSPVLSSATIIDGFILDKAELTPDQLAKIDTVAWSLGYHLGFRIKSVASVKITGHTDTTGTEKYNKGLGDKRAQNAKVALEAALEKEKVAKDRITEYALDSKGETEPAVPTGDNVKEPRNRRVEIEVTIMQPELPAQAEPTKPPILTLSPGPIVPGLSPITPRIPSIPQTSRDWLGNLLDQNKLLKQLPPWAREKAIDALKDIDEVVANKIIDALPWDDKYKGAAKAAMKALLQSLKGKKFKMPQAPPPGYELPPMHEFPTMPGEKIFKLPPIRF